MEGSSSSNIMDNQRLPQHENVTNVSLPPAEYEVPNPHGDDLTLDRETRIRLLNRGYSKKYRQRKNCDIENLEDKQNTLSETIRKEIPMSKVYTNFNSVFKTEVNTSEETLSQVNSNDEVLNVEMNMVINKLEQVKLSKKATEVEFDKKKKFLGK
ncbi:uncharacterized protein LOC127078462 [Lathyrus oleraceus]|uniref:Uncharacterized protein n=1 Tax=Pisum sativum TaxID=3888 RepID=A0A9D5AK39_PEA|nr:uncharacterized protein LOC127078462 [Pisum sativum]KAI5408605.1 hypothetical protein KIW84_054445 [Pisum sativum]